MGSLFAGKSVVELAIKAGGRLLVYIVTCRGCPVRSLRSEKPAAAMLHKLEEEVAAWAFWSS